MKHETLRPEFCYYIPEKLEEGVLYVSMEFETAIHLCACGECGQKTVTPFSHGGWTITVHDEKVSLSPSIGNWQFPCKSHYFLRENRIEWC